MAITENDLLVGPTVPASGVSTISLDFYFEKSEWLEVYKSGSDTPLILAADYTVSGEGTDTGAITLTTPANGVDAYSVYLSVPLERSSDMGFRGEFRSEPFNLEMNRMWQAMQGLRTRLARALTIERTSTAVGALQTEDVAARSGRAIMFSADGQSMAVGPNVQDLTNAQANGVIATSAAERAELAAFEAALYGGVEIDTFTDLSNVTASQVAVGKTVSVRDSAETFVRASGGASDAKYDYSGSGGVKWYGQSDVKTPIAVLFMGQSNLLGHTGAIGGDLTMTDGAFSWDSIGTGGTTIDGTQFIRPKIGTFPFNRYNATEGQYATTLPMCILRELRRRTDRPIYFITVAGLGHSIEAFIPEATRLANGWTVPGGNTDLSAHLFTNSGAMLSAVPKGFGSFDYVFFHQGENNLGNPIIEYRDKVTALFNDLIDAGHVHKQKTRIVFGAISWFNAKYMEHKGALGNRITRNFPQASMADSTGLPIQPDLVHFTARGYEGMAARMVDAAHTRLFENGLADDYETIDVEIADAPTGGNVGTFTAGTTQSMARTGHSIMLRLDLVGIDTTGMTPGNPVYIRNLRFRGYPNMPAEGVVRWSKIVTGGTHITAYLGSAATHLFFFKNGDNTNGITLKVQDLVSGSANMSVQLNYITDE